MDTIPDSVGKFDAKTSLGQTYEIQWALYNTDQGKKLACGICVGRFHRKTEVDLFGDGIPVDGNLTEPDFPAWLDSERPEAHNAVLAVVEQATGMSFEKRKVSKASKKAAGSGSGGRWSDPEWSNSDWGVDKSRKKEVKNFGRDLAELLNGANEMCFRAKAKLSGDPDENWAFVKIEIGEIEPPLAKALVEGLESYDQD